MIFDGEVYDSKYRVFELPLSGDLRNQRVNLSKWSRKIYSRHYRWPTHVAFSRRNDNRLVRFCSEYGAERMIGLIPKWGFILIGFEVNDEPVKKMPRWLYGPSQKEELAATVVRYRKRKKSATDKRGKWKSKSGKAASVKREDWIKSQVTKFHWPLKRGKVTEKLIGLVTEDGVLNNGSIVLAGYHVVSEVNPTGEFRYFVFDDNGKRHVFDGTVTLYQHVTDELLALNGNPDRYPNRPFLTDTVIQMLTGIDFNMNELDTATDKELTEWILDNVAYHSNRLVELDMMAA